MLQLRPREGSRQMGRLFGHGSLLLAQVLVIQSLFYRVIPDLSNQSIEMASSPWPLDL